MQIHELNNFNGELDSGTYLAVDNGTDTGKVSAGNLLSDVRAEMTELDNTLNARIDNIIAGGAAPSEAEIVDARLGAAALGSVEYASLGGAIRGQATDLKNDLDVIADIKHNYFDASQAVAGEYITGSVGSHYTTATANSFYCALMAVQPGKSYRLKRMSQPWYELDANGIILAKHGNATEVYYSVVKPTNPGCVNIGISWDSWGNVTPDKYMALDPDVPFDSSTPYIPYPYYDVLTDSVMENSKLLKSDDFDFDKARKVLAEVNYRENFFDPSTAVAGAYIAGDVGGAIRTWQNANYAYNLIPVEYGKIYIFSRSDYARFTFDENMICLDRIGTQTDVTTDFEYTPANQNVKYLGVSWDVRSGVTIDNYMVTYKGTNRDSYIPYPKSVTTEIQYEEKEIYIGPNREYTSIVDAFRAYANDTEKKTFYIDGGVYDIYSELGGAAFLQSITADDDWRDVCVFVPDNSKVVGLGSVTLNYLPPANEIPSDNAVSFISPLNVSGSVEIENITINCKNCRYAIHDEAGIHRRYDNTKKVYRKVRATKQQNDYVPQSSVISGQSFGCGLGSANEYLFEECYFKSNITAFSMHNNPTIKNYQGTNITLRNCVIDTDGTQAVRFGSVWSQYAMENVVRICDTFLKAKVTVTREAASNNARNHFNVTLLNCTNVETLDDFALNGWASDYDIKVYNPIG